MKTTFFAVALVLLFSFPLFSQVENERRYPSQFSLTESAEVLPNLTFFGRVSAGLFTRDLTTIQGQVSVGIANFIELNVLNSEGLVNFYGEPQPVAQWGFKLRILEGSDQQPSVSFMFRTSFDWKNQEFFDHDIIAKRPSFSSQGLNGTRHGMRLSTGTLVITERVFSRLSLTAGFGVQEIQIRNLWIFIDPAPYVTNGFHDPEIQRTLMFSGLFQAQIDVSSSTLIFLESHSAPMVEPNLTRLSLDYERGFLVSGGVRLIPLFPVSMDLMLSHSFMEIARTEFRVSLGIVVAPR